MLIPKISQEQKVFILLGLFIGALMGANLLGAKITAFQPPQIIALGLNTLFAPLFFVINSIAGLLPQFTPITEPFLSYRFFDTIHVSVGILTVPVMFLITDVIEEVFGKKKANQFIVAGIVTMLFMVFITALSVWLPTDPTRQYFSQEAYASIFGVSIRIMLASILAFLIAQYHDLWAFNFLKLKTNGKYLWLRNNLSTSTSQFIDSVIFMYVAFYGINARFTAGFILTLIIPYWIFKVLFALLDTPFCYGLVKWLKTT